jgi:hypothetical protein
MLQEFSFKGRVGPTAGAGLDKQAKDAQLLYAKSAVSPDILAPNLPKKMELDLHVELQTLTPDT